MIMEVKKRNLNLDLTKCIAVFTVLSVHFFYNNGFYSIPVATPRMYVMTGMRTLFMICVPLFLLVTGALMNRKTLSRQYYRGVRHTLFIYLLSCIACMIFNYFYKGTPYTLLSAFLSIFDFTAAQYSWYVEMYLGLFLIIPFLNLIYQNLGTKRQKQVLVLSFLALTTLPTTINYCQEIIPNWWQGFYPVSYYFLGAYLMEYPPRTKKRFLALFLLLWISFCTAFNIYFCHGEKFVWAIYNGWGGFQNVVSSALVFALIQKLDLSHLPKWVQKLIVQISVLSFGTYLVSYIFDQIFYQKLNSSILFMEDRLVYYPIIVPAVFVCSLILSQCFQWIYQLFFRK